MPSATIRSGDGQHSTARLQTISITGGLLQVLKPIRSGAVVELLFSTQIGSVLAMAELLSPCSSTAIGLQPFRFIAMDSVELRKLRAAIAASWKAETQRTSVSPWPCRQTGTGIKGERRNDRQLPANPA
jgi:hypothetical protein